MKQIYQNIKCHSDALLGVDKLIFERRPILHSMDRPAMISHLSNLDLFLKVTFRQGRILLSVKVGHNRTEN